MNNFSKYVFYFIGVLLLCGCDAIQDIVRTDSETETETPLRVTMVYPSDCVGASDYCDAFHISVKAAESELGITLTEVNGMGDDPVASEAIFRDAARGSDLVLTAGYQMEDVLARVAPDFPDVQFAIFDVVMDVANVASVNYKSNEGSFIVGVVAALKSESGKVGYIGGVDVPLLQEFEAGYVAGVRAVNPDAEIVIAYISPDNPIGFNQPDKAKELALAQYTSGVDVIFTPSAGSAHGVLEAAQEQQKFIIWVDANGNHLAPGIVLTSMTKEIGSVVSRIIHETATGNFMPGIRYFGLKEGGVSYAVDEHNRALLSGNIMATVEAFKAQVIAGEIVVPDTVSLPRDQIAAKTN